MENSYDPQEEVITRWFQDQFAQMTEVDEFIDEQFRVNPEILDREFTE